MTAIRMLIQIEDAAAAQSRACDFAAPAASAKNPIMTPKVVAPITGNTAILSR